MEQNLIFGSVNSSDFGIYISGEGVFNAPKRDVNTFSIPGRNGTFLLDNNRFENIVVTYPAHCNASDLNSFRAQLSNYRNALASQIGYQRLEDTIHSDEYRIAAFIDGFDAEPIGYSTSATFDLKFNCKPQRFLKSGEVSVAITSGNTLTNPTLFESNPLLMARGYGTINLNGQPITIENTVVGDTILLQPFGGSAFTRSMDYANGLVNTGDSITVLQGSKATYTVKFKDSIDLIGVIVGSTTGSPFTVTQTTNYASGTVVFEVVFNKVNYTAGTNKIVSANFTANIQFTEDGLDQSANVTFAPGIDYTANNRRISIYAGGGSSLPSIVQSVGREVRCQQVTAYSTVSALGDPTYIDLEIGEAYKMVNGEAVSLNNSVSIGSTLPTLAVGGNTVTFPNTITSLEIQPRWWRV